MYVHTYVQETCLLSLHLCVLTAPTCSDGVIRLDVVVPNNIGKVEVCYMNQWGTVRADKWTPNDAAVVCRELPPKFRSGIGESIK